MQEGYTFNPNEHLMTIKSRGGSSDYLTVQWRLVWFRSVHPQGSIETEVIMIDLDRIVEAEQTTWNPETRRNEKSVKSGKGFACFRATVKTGEGGIATAFGSESAADFGDFIEKAETKAIGRALAGLGFGTQFAGIDLDEGARIVDAPVSSQSSNTSARPTQASPSRPATAQPANVPVANSNAGTVTARQRESVQKICAALGKSEPEHVDQLSELAARTLIQQLNTEYRQAHPQTQQNRAS